MEKWISLIGSLFLFLGVAVPTHAQNSQRPPVLLSFSVNGETSPETRQGWPLLIIGNLMHRDVYADNVTDVAISGSWSSAVHLIASDEDGHPLPWTFHPASVPSGSLVLDNQTVAELGWWLTPEETAGIEPGSYIISAYLDSLSVQAPFDGLKPANSMPVFVDVFPPEASPTEDEIFRRQLLLADYHVLSDNDTAALVAIDDLLSLQPANVAALTYRAQLLRMDGRLNESVQAYAAASSAFAEANPNPVEPPTVLLNEYFEVLAEIAARKTFDVTVAAKTPLHVYYQQGSTDGFLINGIEGGELWLYEDTTYTFRMVGVPVDNPFYFSTSGTGNGSSPYSDGVAGQPATGNAEVTLTPSATTPDILYYQSMNQPNMGWRIHIIRDVATTGVNPSPITIPIEYHLGSAYPNPFNEETRIELTIAKPQRVIVTLYNVRGQEVRKIFDNFVPGQDSHEFVVQAAGLASGWYIIRVRGETFSDARGIILVK